MDVAVDVVLLGFIGEGDGGAFGEEIECDGLAKEGEFLGEGYAEVLLDGVLEEVLEARVDLLVVVFHVLEFWLLVFEQFDDVWTEWYILDQLIIHKELPDQPPKNPKMLLIPHHRLTHHTGHNIVLLCPLKQPDTLTRHLLNNLGNPLKMQSPTINPLLLHKLNIIRRFPYRSGIVM